MSTLTLISEEKSKKMLAPPAIKSGESLYSSSSSKNSIYQSSVSMGRGRGYSIRQNGFISSANDVRQRVLSAKRLRMKSLQNQLVEAQQNIATLANDNRDMKRLLKKQEIELSNYRNTNAELPKLLNSHAEEIRVWKTKYRNLQTQNKDLANKLKHKESIMLQLSDENKRLTQLDKDKNLEDRERLTNRVHYLENRLLEKDNDMKLMARKLQLEQKSFKTQFQHDQQKLKETTHKLERTRFELNRVTEIHFDKMDQNGSRIPRRLSLNGSKSTKSLVKESSNTRLPDIASSTSFDSIDKSLKSLGISNDFKISKSDKSAESSSRSSGSSKRSEYKLQTVRKNSLKQGNASITQIVLNGMTSTVRDMGLDGSEYDSDYEKNDEDEHFNDLNDGIVRNGNSYSKDQSTKKYNQHESQDEDDVIISKNYNNVTTHDENYSLEMPNVHDILHSDYLQIEKQIAEEDRKRELFLDQVCRDAENDVASFLESTKTTTNAGAFSSMRLKSIEKPRRLPERNIDSKKKTKLLAVLKAIDANGDNEEIAD